MTRELPRAHARRPRIGEQRDEVPDVGVGELAELSYHRSVDPAHAGGVGPREQCGSVGEADDRLRIAPQGVRIEPRQDPHDPVAATREHDRANLGIAQHRVELVRAHLVGSDEIIRDTLGMRRGDAIADADLEFVAEPVEPTR
ncbi:MAG: hypothetical protein JWO36_2340 [Myxococcales bacterium]|nr:hypothetical protein [Myxococcales bacterium]